MKYIIPVLIVQYTSLHFSVNTVLALLIKWQRIVKKYAKWEALIQNVSV